MEHDATNPEPLKESIRQNQPFPSIEVEGYLTLVRTGDRLSDRVSRPLRKKGLTAQQYNILRILRGSHDGLLMHETAERMVSRAPSITRLVDRMERNGWLVRVPCTEDRRAIHLRLTRAGLELLEELDQPMHEAIHEATRGLDSPQMGELCDLLNRLRRPLEPTKPAQPGATE